jgi:O-antigen/teichoic acid export membrane protein
MLSNVINKHTISNYGVKLISIIVNIFLIPFYVRIIGIESYGLIGLFATLQSIMVFFDLGLGTTLGRELASARIKQSHYENNICNLARTLEIIYWIFALILGSAVICFSTFIAEHWLNSNELDVETVHTSILLMGAIVIFRWPISFYTNGIFGLNEILKLNIIHIISLILQATLSVVTLLFISGTIKAFLCVYFLVSFFHVFVLTLFFWSELKTKIKTYTKPQFDKKILIAIYKFSLGVSIFSILSMVVFEIDKILLSYFDNLANFGAYILALTIPLAMLNLVYPLTSVMMPKITELFEAEKKDELEKTFILANQIGGVLTISFSYTFIFNNIEILSLWLGTPELVKSISLLSIIGTIGIFLHTCTSIPAIYLISTKQTQSLIKIYLIPTLIYFFLSLILIYSNGTMGAVIGRSIVSFLLFSMVIYTLSGKFSLLTLKNWLLKSIFFPILIGFLSSYLMNTILGYMSISGFLKISIFGIFVFSVILFSMKELRKFILEHSLLTIV